MFLAPFMLLGLAAVTVPVVIHLLNNRRVQRMRWAAMRFLQASVQRNRRRIRIEDILLLLVRCAIVALLALTLARPVLTTARASLLGRNAVTGVIVIDQSFSMSATDGVASRFDLAKKAALDVIDSLPSGSSAAVYVAADVARPLIPEPTVELSLVRSAIRNAKLCDRAGDLLPAVRAGADVLKRTGGRRAGANELYVITDGQRTGLRRAEDIRKLLDESKDDLRARLVLVGDRPAQPSNLAVTGLEQSSGLTPSNRPLRLVARVTNFGPTEARDVRVRLFVDKSDAGVAGGVAGGDKNSSRPYFSSGDKNRDGSYFSSGTAPVAEATIDVIPPRDARSATLIAKLPGEGSHSVTATIAPDGLPADDARTIALRAVDRLSVLLVDGEPAREPRDAETFFLKNALTPNDSEDAFVRAKVIQPSDLAAQNLDDFAAVVLANVSDLAPSVTDTIIAYVQRGGGLIVFPGELVNRSFYNDELFANRKFLPARFGQPRGDARADKPMLALQDKNFDHPIATLWNDPASGSPGGASFYRVMPLESAETRDASSTQPKTQHNSTGPGEPRVVLRFNDRSPAVMERSFGQGRVVMFASTADTAWNDLAVKPAVYVPLLYRTLGAIVGRQDESMNLLAGEKLVLHPPADLLGRDAVVTEPRGSRDGDDPATKPQQHTLRVEQVDREPTLQFDGTDTAGAYALRLGDLPPVAFAVQQDPIESDPAPADADQLKLLASVADVIEPNGAAQPLKTMIEQKRIGTEIWQPLAYAVLALAACEMLMAHWFSKPK